MRKLSIIIPVYNAEKTIEECLESLIRQTIFEDLELIIVDDASDDNSADIIMDYEARYSENIIFIRLDKNSGPGNARNVAIKYASGKYIGFVDADDAVQPSMYEKMYNTAEKAQADYVDSGFYDQKNDRAIVFVSDELAGELNDEKRSSLIVVGGFIWSKIFLKSFIESCIMIFREEYVLEDMDFLIECTARANRIATVKEIMYVYRNREDSLSKTRESLNYIHNQSSAMKAIYERTSSLPNYNGIREAVEFVMLKLYSNVINECTNLFYLKKQSRESVLSMLSALKVLKDSMITGDYGSEYIKKGINDVNLTIIKANDVSPEAVLDLLKDD